MKKGKPELRKKGERREERMEGGGVERQMRKGERKWYNCVIFLITLVMPAVVVRRWKPHRRKDGTTLYFEGTLTQNIVLYLPSTHHRSLLTDNVEVIVNNKGEMKGS